MSDNKIFGLMIDAARQPESLDTCKSIVDFAAEWQYNTILFRLSDDQGIAVCLDSVPELIKTPDAFDKEEITELVSYAENKGIMIIPEVESFGHSRYISDAPEFEHMRDISETSGATSGLCPAADGVLALIEKIYIEVSALFKSPYIHGGCDEVNWGGSQLSKQVLKSKSRDEIWSEYVNSLNSIVKKLNLQFMIWADHTLRKNPETLKMIDRDIILLDWEYNVNKPEEIKPYTDRALENKFKIIGAPAMFWGKWLLHIGAGQLRNITAWCETFRNCDNPDFFGIIVTNWCPWRYLSNSYLDSAAYASVAFHKGSRKAADNAFRLFVEKHYGAKWNSRWKQLFAFSGKFMLPRWKSSHPLEYPFIQTPWKNEETLLKALALPDNSIPAEETACLLQLLESCSKNVRKNYSDFSAFKISLEYYENIYSRIVLMQKATDNNIAETIQKISRKDQRILNKLEKMWDNTRNPASVMKRQYALHTSDGQQILPEMYDAANYSKQLTPQQLKKIVQKIKK